MNRHIYKHLKYNFHFFIFGIKISWPIDAYLANMLFIYYLTYVNSSRNTTDALRKAKNQNYSKINLAIH